MALVCAHRGASLELADNSLPAFAAAIAAGAELIETDVRLRPDGVLVLAHDTWDVAEPAVVTLGDLVELARGRVGLDLEIVEFGLERAVLDAVDGFPGQVIITSTYPEVLTEVTRLTQHIATGLVIEAPGGEIPPLRADPFTLAAECGAQLTLVEDELATPQLLERVASPLWVFTVNDADRLAELLATPTVAGVITDDPALAVDVRAAVGAAGEARGIADAG